jgi:DNA-directed RNA polymerase specialized sigma subunit
LRPKDSSETLEVDEEDWEQSIPTVSEALPPPTGHEALERTNERKQTLKVLRSVRRFSQQALASMMGTSQGEISRIEKRKDMHISTLRSYIRAIGGEVIILAKFSDEEVVQVTI